MTLEGPNSFSAKNTYLQSVEKSNAASSSSDKTLEGVTQGQIAKMKAQYEKSCEEVKGIKKILAGRFKSFGQVHARWENPKYWEGMQAIRGLVEGDKEVPTKILFWEAWPLKFKFKIFGNPLVMKFDNPRDEIKAKLKNALKDPALDDDLKLLVILTLEKFDTPEEDEVLENLITMNEEIHPTKPVKTVAEVPPEATPDDVEIAIIDETPPPSEPSVSVLTKAIAQKRCILDILAENPISGGGPNAGHKLAMKERNRVLSRSKGISITHYETPNQVKTFFQNFLKRINIAPVDDKDKIEWSETYMRNRI
ncbi:MAG: hypothetical protein ACI9S8_001528 [Chlamydiales bacterium]|jgi:hypothetical protein